MNTLIAYHSDYGSTEKMAKAIAAGFRASLPGSTMQLKTATQTGLDDLIQADVIIFGTPVHMGSMAWQLKKLIDEAGKLWMEDGLEGKIGAVFASGGGYGSAGGGVEQTMISLHSNFLEHGMLVVGFPKSLPGFADGGLHWGAYGRTGDQRGMPAGISDTSLAAARSFGTHIAEVAATILD